MKKAVIFDMDGVIAHTNPYHSLAFREFFKKRDLYPTDEEFAVHMFGKSNSYILEHFLGRKVVGEEFTAMEEEKEGLFRELYAEHVKDIEGFMSFLSSLKDHGFLTGVATSAPRENLTLIMGKLGFGERMESTLSSEDVSRHKPDPEVYLKSALNLGVDPKQCIVFEDSFSGITAATRAGMQVVGVLSSHRREELPPCALYIENYKTITALDLLQLLRL
jgi:beta-phosphoglucomutase